MSNNPLHTSENLKKALFSLPPGMPVTASHLKEYGISRQLTHYYVQNGWLTLLGKGYYQRPGLELTMPGVVASLQHNGVRIHIGGKSALALKGFSHYLRFGEDTLTLYGSGVRSLPTWLSEKFKVELSSFSLFEEGGEWSNMLSVSRYSKDEDAPYVSEPERAVLEMLALVPQKQGFDESFQIMEALQSLRSKKLQVLLANCKKVKVKRLFWTMAKEMGLPVLKKLDQAGINFGSNSPYILQSDNNRILTHPNER